MLPKPELYKDWQSWASAFMRSLGPLASVDTADFNFVTKNELQLRQFVAGEHMLIVGNGVGVGSAFLLWFGPQVAVEDMDEGNGLFWLKTDGSVGP